MKHSNRFYIVSGNKESRYEEVTGHRVKNKYGLDLFHCKNSGKKTLYEAVTGLKMASEYPDDVDTYLDEKVRPLDPTSKLRIEVCRGAVLQAMHIGKITPRYTEPDNMKPKTPKKQSTTVLSKCLYAKGRKYFVPVVNDEEVKLYRLKSSMRDNSFYLYIPSTNPDTGEVWMCPYSRAWADDTTQVQHLVEQIKNGLNMDNLLREKFEMQMADPIKWADVAIAEYLGRADEAKVHNEPITAKRKAENDARALAREKQKAEEEAAEQAAEEKAVLEAEKKLRDGEAITADEFLALCKRYSLTLPIKLKGWIYKSLYTISPNTYQYSGNRSTTIFHYYRQLRDRIQLEQ